MDTGIISCACITSVGTCLPARSAFLSLRTSAFDVYLLWCLHIGARLFFCWLSLLLCYFLHKIIPLWSLSSIVNRLSLVDFDTIHFTSYTQLMPLLTCTAMLAWKAITADLTPQTWRRSPLTGTLQKHRPRLTKHSFERLRSAVLQKMENDGKLGEWKPISQ